ncbi:MAG: NAD(P)H-dependent oxidoreductase [Caulobacteraceae bacterium]|nr:NAD(P)H-dependent oxidoreductase [Caulobacteraceae bacterium]
MKIAVVLAHPDPGSFNAAVAHACIGQLARLGHQVLLRDLYGMNFDPRLKRGEIPGDKPHKAERDVAEERAMLAEVDGFVFVYPFWFNAPPAILKGYVDRVFSMDFGYALEVDRIRPLLGGRKLVSFSTSGASEHWVHSSGALDALMTLFDLHLSNLCGLSTSHTHFGDVTRDLTPEAGEQRLRQVRQVIARHFPEQAPARAAPGRARDDLLRRL